MERRSEAVHVQDSINQTDIPTSTGSDPVVAAELKRLIEKAASLLPSQGPITAFVFLNTLQALEDLPFDEGVQKGARLFGCQPYLTEDNYRDKLAQDRIYLSDLELALKRDLKEQADVTIASVTTRSQLRLAMLQYPLRTGPTEELQWFVAETDALTRLRPDAPSSVRDRFLTETKHWVMRDLRTTVVQPRDQVDPGLRSDHPLPIVELIDRFGKASI